MINSNYFQRYSFKSIESQLTICGLLLNDKPWIGVNWSFRTMLTPNDAWSADVYPIVHDHNISENGKEIFEIGPRMKIFTEWIHMMI